MAHFFYLVKGLIKKDWKNVVLKKAWIESICCEYSSANPPTIYPLSELLPQYFLRYVF